MSRKLDKKSLQGFTGFGNRYKKKARLHGEERSVLYLSLRSALPASGESYTGGVARDPQLRVDSFPCVCLHVIGTGGCTLMGHQGN